MSTSATANVPNFIRSATCSALQSLAMRAHLTRAVYLQAARQLEDAALIAPAHLLRYTAAQEKEHAAIWSGLSAANGCPLTSAMPELPDLPSDPVRLLRFAAEMEDETINAFLRPTLDAAQQEGYQRIKQALLHMQETEQTHAVRFRRCAEGLSDGSLFTARQRTSWLCLPCGQLHYGASAPDMCDGCSANRSAFVRGAHYPFGV